MKVITFGLSISLIFCVINGEYIDKGDGSLESVSDLDLPLFLKSLLRLYEADGYDKNNNINQVVIKMSQHLSLSPVAYQRLIRILKATRKELKGGDDSLKAINSMIWLRGSQIDQKAVIRLIRKIVELSENPKAVAVGVKKLARDLAKERFPMSRSDKRVIRSDKGTHLNPEDLSRILSHLPGRIVEILINDADSFHSELISHFDKGTDTEVILDFLKERIRSVNRRILEILKSEIHLEDSEVEKLDSEVGRVFEKVFDSALDQYVLGNDEPWKPEGTVEPLGPLESEVHLNQHLSQFNPDLQELLNLINSTTHLTPESLQKLENIICEMANSIHAEIRILIDKNSGDVEMFTKFGLLIDKADKDVIEFLESAGVSSEDSEVNSDVAKFYRKILDYMFDNREPPVTLTEDEFLSRIREISRNMQDQLISSIKSLSAPLSAALSATNITDIKEILTSGDLELQKALGRPPGTPNPHIQQVIDTLHHISDNQLIRIFGKQLLEDVVLQGVEHLVGGVRAQFQKHLKAPRPRDPRIQKFIGSWLQEHGFRDSEDLAEALAEAYDGIGGDEWFWTVGDFFERHVEWEMFRIQKSSIEELLGDLEDSEDSEGPLDPVLPYLSYLHSAFRMLLNPRGGPFYQPKPFIDRFADAEVDSEDTDRILRSLILPILKSTDDPREGGLENGTLLGQVGAQRETIAAFSDLLSTTTISRRDLIPFLRFLIDFSRQMGGVKHVRKSLISGARLLSATLSATSSHDNDNLDDVITLINQVGQAMEKIDGLSARLEHLEVIRGILGPFTSRVLDLYGSGVPDVIFSTSRVLPRHVPLELFEELVRILKSDEPLVRDLLKHFTSSDPKYLHVGPLKKSLGRAHARARSQDIRDVLEWFQLLLDDVAVDDVELEDWLRSLDSIPDLQKWSRGVLEILKEPEGDWSKIREAHEHIWALWKDIEDPLALDPILDFLELHNWNPELLTAIQQLSENQKFSKKSNIDFLLVVFSRYSDEPLVLVEFLKDLGIDSGKIGDMDRKTRFLEEMVGVLESAGSFSNLNRLLEFHSIVTTNHTDPRDSQRMIRDLLIYLGLHPNVPPMSQESLEKSLKLILPCRIFHFPGVKIQEIQELVSIYGKDTVVEAVAREPEYGQDFEKFKEILKELGPKRVKRFEPFNNFSFKKFSNFGHKLHKDTPYHQKPPKADRKKRDSGRSLEMREKRSSNFFHLDPLHLQNLGHRFREPTHEETSSLDKIIQSNQNRRKRSIQEQSSKTRQNQPEDPNQSIFAGTGTTY